MGDNKKREFTYLKDNWIDRMVFAMKASYPDESESTLRKMVEDIYSEKVKDHQAKIYNSYEETISPVSLVEMVDWYNVRKPLIAESGVYFYPKKDKENLNVRIIKEKMLDARKIHKKEKFKAKEAGDVFLTKVKDIQQANDKKAANSGYGAEGERSSFLYNLHSAMSVTSCGRGQISTACQCFENLLADNVKFMNMDEFYTYVYNIVSEKPERKFDTNKVLGHNISSDEWVDRFKGKFIHETVYDEEEVLNVYYMLNKEERKRVYYKANMFAFLRLPDIRNLFDEVVYKKLDGKEFVDPNDIPDKLKDSVGVLTDMMTEFIGYKFSVFRYEDRTRYEPRGATIVIDE